jgi:voltage-dependent anion channel protein 2
MPPKFADINKSVNDLFSDDFGFGVTKLVLKSKAANGTAFKVEGVKSAKGDVEGFLETKFNHGGVSVKEKWSTTNDVVSEFAVDNKFLPGSKITAEAVFNPNKGIDGLKLKLKNDYEKDNFNSTLQLTSGGVVSTSGVFSFGGKYLVGAAADYDSSKGAISSTKFAVSYVESDLTVSSSIINGSDVEGAVYHVPNKSVAAGLKFSWNQSNATNFELAGKYRLDSQSFVKAKINKALNLGLSYTQTLTPGVSITLATLVKGADLQGDGHQLGLTLTFEQP